jgi:PAS domain S-box-containing protein
MNRYPITLNEKDSFGKAVEVFTSHKTNGIPIVNEEGVMTGIISLARAFRLLSEATDPDVLLERVMIKNPIVVEPEEDIGELIERPVSALPVVKDERLVGMYSMPDTIRAYYNSTKTAYEELSQTKEIMQELEVIIETSSDGILVADENGDIVKVNTALANIFGEATEAIVGKNIRGYENIFGEGILNRLHSEWKGEGKKEKKDLPLYLRIGEKRLLAVANPIIAENRTCRGFVMDIQDITRMHELERQVNRLEILYQREIKKSAAAEKYVFKDPNSSRLLERILQIARVDSTVLITGESGTGKEVVAEILFNSGSRSDKPFVKINCGAIPEALLESELFGYEQGAFTGAGRKGKSGMLEIANHGTVFLDEIDTLPLLLQVKLLRVLQGQEIMRVGGVTPRKIDVRIIAATNNDLAEMVKRGSFRLDLYYRLNVVPIFVPPLRDRKEDIPALLHYFLNKYNEKYKLSKSFDAVVIEQLLRYRWPGNIRELENMVERFVVTGDSDAIDGLPEEMLGGSETARAGTEDIRFNRNYKDIVNDYEVVLLGKALDQYGTTRKMAAALGLNQSTIVKKMSRLGIAR